MITRINRRLQKQFVTPRQIEGFQTHRDPLMRAVGEALAAHQAGRLTAQEEDVIERIEKIRAELCRSREQLVVPDYGAGSPDSTLAESRQSEGPVVVEIVGDVCQNFSKPRVWATLLFQLVRHTKPVVCVELGTCLGISAAYQSAALSLNNHGKLTTLDGAPSFAGVAARNLETLKLTPWASVVVGRFQDTLPGLLAGPKIDYAFIDGHHDEQATLRYYEMFLPHLAERSTLIFDDISWSKGMSAAWNQIRRHPRVDVSLDCSSVGICLLGAEAREHHDLVLV